MNCFDKNKMLRSLEIDFLAFFIATNNKTKYNLNSRI
jgi:hypothetical protein